MAGHIPDITREKIMTEETDTTATSDGVGIDRPKLKRSLEIIEQVKSERTNAEMDMIRHLFEMGWMPYINQWLPENGPITVFLPPRYKESYEKVFSEFYKT